MAKYCPNCGTKVTTDAKFCPKCGYQLSSAAASTTSEHEGNATGSKAYDRLKGAKAQVKKASTKHGYGKWIVGAVIVIILIVVGYRQVYVPHVINSAVESNSFTSSNGYSVTANTSKKQVIIYANSSAQQKIANQLIKNGYDTRKISVENNLGNLAHDLSGKMFGKWQVVLAVKEGQKASMMWEYNGIKEVHRFQTSQEGRNLRQEYLERLQQEQEQAQQEDNAEKIGAGLLGGGLGLLLGSL